MICLIFLGCFKKGHTLSKFEIISSSRLSVAVFESLFFKDQYLISELRIFELGDIPSAGFENNLIFERISVLEIMYIIKQQKTKI